MAPYTHKSRSVKQFLGASWSQDGPQTPQLGAKMNPRPPNLEPRWPPDPPTWSQDNLLTPQLGAKMAPGPPTWSQDGPQTSNLEPGWPPDPPTWSQDGHQTFKSRSYFLLSPGTVAGLAVRQLDTFINKRNYNIYIYIIIRTDYI